MLRRLVPMHVTLLLDVWKGAPSPDLTGPFEKAEAAFAAGDFAAATTALDLLSVRLAEPRWPTTPEPFRLLRVPIKAPVPPHWDPDHALSAGDKDSKKQRTTAEDQLALARGAVAWAAAHGVDASDLGSVVEGASAHLAEPADLRSFYEGIDGLWASLRGRLPRPKNAAVRAAPPAAAEAEEA